MPPLMLNGNVIGKWTMKNHKLTITTFKQVFSNDKKAIINQAESIWNDISKINFE